MSGLGSLEPVSLRDTASTLLLFPFFCLESLELLISCSICLFYTPGPTSILLSFALGAAAGVLRWKGTPVTQYILRTRACAENRGPSPDRCLIPVSQDQEGYSGMVVAETSIYWSVSPEEQTMGLTLPFVEEN